MDQSGATSTIRTLSTGSNGEHSAEQFSAQTDQQQSPAPKLAGAQLSESHSGGHGGNRDIIPSINAETRGLDEKDTIQCICGSPEDDRNVISCGRCGKQQHIACYYPDQENETLGEEFRHICVNCATHTPLEDVAETTDEEDEEEEEEEEGEGESVDEYTSGFSEASASASIFGEASTDGNNVPDVFFYMTQDASGAVYNNTDDDTLRVPLVNEAVREFREQFFVLSQIPLKWEDPERLDSALTVMPLHQIYEQAEKTTEEAVLQQTQSLSLQDEAHGPGDWGYNDFVIMALMQWFKRDFFTWETSPSCPVCSSPTKAQGETEPTAKERQDSALVVELYVCCNTDCGASQRFPRYSDPWKLLETRRGRLAEWANCFGMLCRAVGARVRWVWNADKGHIWLEVYSEKKARWVSVDILEVAWDKSLLYTEGKCPQNRKSIFTVVISPSLIFQIAFSCGTHSDVDRS